MRPQIAETQTLTDDADGIFEAQTLGGAGAVSLNGALVSGGIAYLYGVSDTSKQGQQVTITSVANDVGVVATIVGTGMGNEPLTVDLALSNASTATTDAYFRTVSSITVDGATTGDISGGWLASTGGSMLAFKCDYTQSSYNQSLTVSLSSGASITYTVENTVDMPQDDYSPSTWEASGTWFPVTGLNGETVSAQSNIFVPVTGVKLNWTGTGTAKFTAIQGHSGW